jgi:hypothetical protein
MPEIRFFIFSPNVQAHPPDGRGGASNAELRLELEKGKFDTSAHPVGCRALFGADFLAVRRPQVDRKRNI